MASRLGTDEVKLRPRRMRVPCQLKKPNILFLMNGPPAVTPYWFCRNGGFLARERFAKKLVKRPVQLVRTGLGRDDDLRAGAIAVFGRHVVGDHLELRYGIDGRFHRLRLEAQRAAGIARAVVAAVEQDVVLRGV